MVRKRLHVLTRFLTVMLLLLPLSQLPIGFWGTWIPPARAVGSWNPLVPCTPITVRISDITAGATGTTSFSNSAFSPGITTTVSGGVAKRWLTAGPTPSGWHSPGPACTITNNKGQSQGVFVEIDGIKRASAVYEDSSNSFDATNGGGSYSGGTRNDHTFNAFDPALVSDYQSSCSSSSDPTCYGRIHMEIDHDWQAAGYCGSGSACDPAALDAQTTAASTIMDFQGFVFWDGPSCCSAQDHSFSGWELHPLTGWRIHVATPTPSFTYSPSSPAVGQTVTFTGSASGGTTPYTFSWTFGDGGTATGSSATHAYSTAGSFTVTLSARDSLGTTGTTSQTVTVGGTPTPDFSIITNPTGLTFNSGSSATSTVTLTSLNSFSGTVSLSSSVSPSGLTATLSPASVSITSGGTATSTLTASSSSPGSYTIIVTGTSSSLSHSSTLTVSVVVPSVTVASDGAIGTSSIATAGGAKLIQDSVGRMIAVYVDSSGRIGLSYANGDPISGTWSTPTKSPTPVSAYATPAALLVSLTSLRIISGGGALAGAITDIPVTITRDSQNNITGFSFGTPTTLDSSGLGRYPTAVLAHNNDLLLAWAWENATRSMVKSLRWDPATGWTNLAGLSNAPDTALTDSASIVWLIPSIIERPDNNKIYLLANRLSGPPSTLAFNLATWNGAAWSWGSQNLTYETNASSGVEDPVAFAWDPVGTVAVVSYGITGTQSFGVFTLTSADVKTHLDTPSLSITERDWGTVSVHVTTGDYYLFLMNVNTDGGSGSTGYIRHTNGGSWTTSVIPVDSSTSDKGLSMRASGTTPTLDLLYAQGTSSPAIIRFARLSPLNPPNFSVSASPASLTVASGTSGTSTITVASLYGFSGTVSLSATVSPSGLTAVLTTTSVSVSSGGTASSTLTVSSSTSGTYTVTVTATGSSLTHTVKVTVAVTDFTISTPSSLTVITGILKTSTITVASVNGFAGTVSLAASTGSGLSVSLSPQGIQLAAGGTGTSTLTLNSNTLGTYTVTVTGTSGSLSHSLVISVSVIAPPNFGISASPTTVTFPRSSSGTSAVTVTSLFGFAGTLILNSSVNPSTGLNVACSPTSFTLIAGGSGTSNCNLSSSITDFYTVTFSASNGTVTHSTNITVNVTEFSISANLTSWTLLVGISSSSTITLTSTNGFSGTVSLALSAPGSVTASLSQTSLTLNNGLAATSTLTFSSSAIGNYTLTVTATSGPLTHSVQIDLQVVDFSVTAGTSEYTVFAGKSGSSTINLNSLGGFTGTITLAATVSPGGLTASTSPSTVALSTSGSGSSTLTVSSSTGGTYTVTVIGTSGGVSHLFQITINVVDFSASASPSAVGFQSGANGTSTVTLTSLGGFNGTIGLSESVSPSTGLTVFCSPGNVTLFSGGSASSVCDFASSSKGTYTVVVTELSGSLTHTTTITVGVGDFSISSSSSSIILHAGSSATATLTVTSTSGFTGTISLSTSVAPAGLSASTNPQSVNLSPGGTITSTLTISSNVIGNYTVTVTGTIGSLSHSIIVTVSVVDFTITAGSITLTILRGASGTSQIQLGSLNGFAGTVTLSTSVDPTGLTGSLSPFTIALSSGGSTSSTLTVTSSTAGNYSVTITATSGSLTHTTQVIVRVVDFTVSASPGSLSIPAGSSSTPTITLTSINGLSGNLSLSSTVSPSGLATSLSPTAVSLSAGGTGASTLDVSVPGNASPGVYTVTVTVAMGSLSHTVTVTVNVPDFGISGTPTSITLNVGSSAASTISLASIGQFSGTVTLGAVSSGNLTVTVNPANVTLSSGGTGTSTVTLSSGTVGSYTVTVTGMSGSFTHTVTLTVTVVARPQYALVTSFSGQVYKLQNGTLTLIGQPVTTALRQIAWKPDGSYALIVGDTAVLLKWNGTTLTRISTSAVMSQGDDLNTVAWNPSGAFAIMGGTSGDLLGYDGTTLTRITNPSTHQIQGISWKLDGTSALIVGNVGTLLSYQNGVVTILNPGTTSDLYGIAWNPSGQYALASGANGAILRYNGTATLLSTAGLYPATTIVRFIAWNGAGTQALLVGNAGGLVLSYNGSTLSVVPAVTTNGLFSLAWSGNTATIVGNSGTMLTYSNGVLKTVATGVTFNLRGIAWKPT